MREEDQLPSKGLQWVATAFPWYVRRAKPEAKKQQTIIAGDPTVAASEPSRSAEQILRDYGVQLDSYVPGRHYALCPECSHRRSTAEHRKAKVLGVTIDHDGVTGGCNHCKWTFGGKLNGKGNSRDRELPSHVYAKDGVPYARKVRNAPGRAPKCWWEYPDGEGGWVSPKKAKERGLELELPSREDRQRLYRIDEVDEAVSQGRRVAVVEGEGDADTLWAFGIPATCSPDGASEPNKKPKWTEAHSEQLRGADTVVFNDNDPPGYAHADVTCRLSLGVAKSVRRLDLKPHWPEIGKGEDVSDWLAKGGGSREKLDELMAGAPPYQAQAVEPASVGTDYLPQWRNFRRDGSPADTMHNAREALAALGVECSHDTFHNRLLVGRRGDGARHELQAVVGELSDHTVIRLRSILSGLLEIEFNDKSVRDAVTSLALERCFDPVRDMLDQAQAAWDGTERLDRMAVDYANCEDTKLNRAVMRKTMVAAVRRARRPGCKFDNITVLESDEGWNKSTFWRVLAGDENFSDESILGKSGREIQEHLSEVWIHESADLAGMRKAEVESVKAFASRQVDIARPAYGYFVKKQPRHAVNVGTTNSDEYLQSQTGNRRFWPLKVLKRIDTEKLERDRLQLWGEAAACEAKGEPVTIPQNLWGIAAVEQEKRRVKDPWESVLADMPETVEVHRRGAGRDEPPDTIRIIHDLDDIEFVTSADLLTYVLQAPIDRQDRYHEMRLADAMKRLGWDRRRATVNKQQRRGFARLANQANLPGMGSASEN
jgi:predicted P-loop ATPase